LRGRDHSDALGVDGRIILKFILMKYIGKAMSGFIWFRTGTGGGLL
jgi:hypothetical protein